MVVKRHEDSHEGPKGPPSVMPDTLPIGIDPTSYMEQTGHYIDFVFAYKPLKATAIMNEYRNLYERKMWESGLELEYQALEQSQDGKTCFLKVHAPWDTIARMAEINRIKMPIQKSDLDDDDEVDLDSIPIDPIQQFFCCGNTPFYVEENLRAADIPAYFTLEFRKDQMRYFLNKDKNTFFPQHIRIQLVWEILNSITISSEEISGPRLKNHRQGEKVGLKFLQAQRVFKDVFPLHDSDVQVNEFNENVKPNSLWPLRN